MISICEVKKGLLFEFNILGLNYGKKIVDLKKNIVFLVYDDWCSSESVLFFSNVLCVLLFGWKLEFMG